MSSSSSSSSSSETESDWDPGTEAVFTITTTPLKCNRIVEFMGEALQYQSIYEKRTSPWEREKWKELDEFTIDEKLVDRVYYLRHTDDVGDREFDLVGRMEYNNNQKVYFILRAGCDFTGCNCQGGGSVFVTLDPQQLLHSLLPHHMPNDIWEFMVQEDGLNVESLEGNMGSPPKLLHLCNQTIYKHRNILAPLAALLPPLIATNVDEYIKWKDTVTTTMKKNDSEDELL